MEDGPLAALISYERSPTWMALLHTEVQEGFEGLGIGTQIVARVIDDARDRGLAVVPRCPFVRRWLERHPEQQDVLVEPLRGDATPARAPEASCADQGDTRRAAAHVARPFRLSQPILRRHRQDAGPDRPVVVLLVVRRRAAAHLGRGVLE